MSQAQGSDRSTRLRNYFNQILQGKRGLMNAEDGKRFLEALCDHQDPSNCVEKIIASRDGLKTLNRCLRLDVSRLFLNGLSTDFLKYITDPALKQLCNGHFFQQILAAVVDPPTFWNSLFQAHQEKALTQDAVQTFAWLLLELLSSVGHGLPDVSGEAQTVTRDRSLLDSPSFEIRNLGHKVKHVLATKSSNGSLDGVDGPGGRHDNDFADFRAIAIFPTADEITSNEKPFYRRADAIDEVDAESRGGMHLDNQFRLLREDFLGELRNDLQIAQGKKKGRRTSCILHGLVLEGIDCGSDQKFKPFHLTFSCTGDIPQLFRLEPQARKLFIKDNRNFMKHQSFGCLIRGTELLSFATLDRNEDLLAKTPPVLVLRITGEAAFTKTLLAAKTSNDLQFFQVDTAVFAYEPVLKCLQAKAVLPLEEQLFCVDSEHNQQESDVKPTNIIEILKSTENQDLQPLLKTPKSITLDSSQVKSLLAGLTQTLSLIQGPPGTGKSFIGALIAKIMHDHTAETILVICYTNHALDQFLEDLLDIGIPENAMLRLGSKSTPRTECLNLSKQQSGVRSRKLNWDIINVLKYRAEDCRDELGRTVSEYKNQGVGKKEILEYLEFSSYDSLYYYALTSPQSQDGMTRVGRKGKAIGKYYLFDRWEVGQDAGVLSDSVPEEYHVVWNMDASSRASCITRWKFELVKEHAVRFYGRAQEFDRCEEQLKSLFNEKNAAIIKSKRVIGCTTTAAAKYTLELQNASAGLIIVEEAGEILESHVLTAMTPDTKQLVLIGDHQQLRPKVNNYALTVEKGNGYNLNVSLFERLVLAGVPHTTLMKQHRMCPQISSLIRVLTYPNLLDAPNTLNRPALRGFQDIIIFFNHEQPEVEMRDIADRRDDGSKSSKQNEFEVDMVLKCVRYLGQQGYSTEQLVILTPYLGQLRLLRDKLCKENDPVLNDLDSYDLVRAGLLPAASANVQKRPIKISTIDNYQGEESDIVIATLTRSNPLGEVGFMAAPQRLNVLLSRARNALIMIGNANTFMNSRKGKEVWQPLFDHLKQNGHIYHGFPVKCERHPDKRRLLQRKEDFETECPDGGCSDPCEIKLNCGIHYCPQQCHQLYDHSKVSCERIIESKCAKSHKMTWKCFNNRPATCRVCDNETRAIEERRRRDHELELERAEKQRLYAKQVNDLKTEIDYQRRLLKDKSDQEERNRVIAQFRQDLDIVRTATATFNILPEQKEPTSPISEKSFSEQPAANIEIDSVLTPRPTPTPTKTKKDAELSSQSSTAKDDWEYQKRFEKAGNDALDSLMSMIGLEDVKQKFLDIKSKVDTVIRQDTELKGERYGAAFLGSPGTGKTTVARLYADFLASVGALPGNFFVETSGSRLSNDGIAGCKKHLEDIQNNGGGALFVDEAYQLVSGHNFGGAQVLDFLLTEMENLTGKVVFILAGYNKQMEAFFAHNPGLPSRIPYQIQFQDYDDVELLKIVCSRVNAKYKGNMKVEGGLGGLYLRILARRIGRGRGRDGFGNARAVHNAVALIADRQAKRLQRDRRTGKNPDDLLLTKEDIIGPEPSGVLKDNKAWTKLQSLIGLSSVKQSVKALLDGIQTNYNRELEEKPLIEYSLNRVFFGSPGTGKTSVAKLYGEILADIGLLTNGEVIIKNPADFVGNVLGQSENNTKAILAATAGKVLIIDEAYMLAGGANGASSGADPYKTAVIDTIVAEVQSTPGEDRCVLLLGYKDQMEEMFQNVNPGLSRRFPLTSAFLFEDFTDDELGRILTLKLEQQGFEVTPQGRGVALDSLRRARNQPHFGNAGEVDILLNKAMLLHQKHLSSGKTKLVDMLEAWDFDEDFDRGERASTNCRQLFAGVIGCEDIVAKLEGYQTTAANMRALGMNPREQIPFNFLFRGPPGTGKTTTARRMGKVYYDMGFLATAEVVECSATDLIGQFVGQTGPKTQKLFEKSLGKVLFIDEAYRLAEGNFATEAMDEIVDCLTKQKFAQKLVTILAGYDEDINRLMSINPGLTSRFPEAIVFRHLKPEECLKLFAQLLEKNKYVNTNVLKQSSTSLRHRLVGFFAILSQLPSWGNARDIQTLVKHIFGKILSTPRESSSEFLLTEDLIFASFESMISERAHRAQSNHSARRYVNCESAQATAESSSKPPYIVDTSTAAASDLIKLKSGLQENPETHSIDGETPRDSGVSNAVWQTLQEDIRLTEARERDLERIEEQLEKCRRVVAEEQARAEAQARELSKIAADDEARRRHEEARLKKLKEQRARDQELEALERRRKAAEAEKQKEAQAQKKLRQMGVCPAGFRWVKQNSGYRCSGGSHFVSDAALGFT